MSGSNFKHIGNVTSIELGAGSEGEGVVVVVLNKLAACEGCKAKGKCSISGSESSESTSSVMRIATQRAKMFQVGEKVEVSITYKVGAIAVLFTYLIPLIVFLVVIASLLAFDINEGLAAGVTFGVVAIYYMVIYLLRERFERVVQFDIEKIY